MRVVLSWAGAAVGVAVCGWRWGWPGVLLGTGMVVFWLLLQFSRALRALQAAGRAPVGTVPNAVMLHARLRAGMKLVQILPLTGSLGQPGEAEPGWEVFEWTDAAGDRVRLRLQQGRLRDWLLQRRGDPPA